MSQQKFCCPYCGKTYSVQEIKANEYACPSPRCVLRERLMIHGDIGTGGKITQVYGWVLEKGTVLNNRYVIEKLLGKGGFGATYLARDRKIFDKLRAIKEIPMPFFDEKEEEFLSILEHPAIPQLIERFNLAPLHYSIMEYVEGRGMDELVYRSKTGLPESEVMEYAKQICDVLGYIHSQKVIHRDLKPENILITREKTIALIDFGIAKQFDVGKGTRRLARAASSFFSSPEQYQAGKGFTDMKSDLYSLGAILYFALTGKEPVDALSRDPQKDISPKPRELNPLISAHAEKVILKALKMQKQQRYSSALQMKKALLGERITSKFICSKCGSIITEPANYCSNCGHATKQLSGKNAKIFVFRNGDRATDLRELVEFSYKNWDDAKFHLSRGDFYDWLILKNKKSLARKAKQFQKRKGDSDELLDEFLNQTGCASPAEIKITPEQFELSNLTKGSKKRFKIDIKNAGKGLLKCEIKGNEKWLSLSESKIKCKNGDKKSIDLTIDPQNLKSNQKYKAKIIVQSVLGNRIIPIVFSLLPAPATLKVEPERLALEINPNKSLTAFFNLKNVGNNDKLVCELDSRNTWLQVRPKHFKAANKKVKLKIDSKNMLLGKYPGQITVKSQAGRQAIPIDLTVKKGAIKNRLIAQNKSLIFSEMAHPILFMLVLMLGIYYLGQHAEAKWGSLGIVTLLAGIGGLFGIRKSFSGLILGIFAGGGLGYVAEYGIFYAFRFLENNLFHWLLLYFSTPEKAQSTLANWSLFGIFIGSLIGLFRGFVLIRHLWTYFFICVLGLTILMGIIWVGLPVLLSGQ